MHTSSRNNSECSRNMLKVCTNAGEYAHFEQGKQGTWLEHAQSVHERWRTCTLRAGITGNAARTYSKYARTLENMHTSSRNNRERGRNMLKVCTNAGEHAHFEQGKQGTQPEHAQSVHEHRRTCTLRAGITGNAAGTCSKCARTLENMHTSSRDERSIYSIQTGFHPRKRHSRS